MPPIFIKFQSDSDNLSDDLDSVKSSPSDYDISDGKVTQFSIYKMI